MWAFLSSVLEKGGFVALLFTIVIAAVGYVTSRLWLDNQALHGRLRDQAEAHAKQLSALYERRVEEAQRVTEAVTKHVAQVDHSMEKLGTAVQVLIDLTGRG